MVLNPNSIKAFHFSFIFARYKYIKHTLNTRHRTRARHKKREYERDVSLYIGRVKERELKAPLIKWFCIHTFKGNYRP